VIALSSENRAVFKFFMRNPDFSGPEVLSLAIFGAFFLDSGAKIRLAGACAGAWPHLKKYIAGLIKIQFFTVKNFSEIKTDDSCIIPDEGLY